MMRGGSNVLVKPKCRSLLIPRMPANMATRVASAQSAKTKVQQGTKKEVTVDKTTKLCSNGITPVAPVSVGTSSCPKCENANKENMIECRWCLRWLHDTCESLDNFQLEFLTKNKHKVPYTCIECRSLMDSYFGKVLKECHENLKEEVSQTKNGMSLIDDRLKAVEHLSNYEENVKFQEAVDKRFEKYITTIKSDMEEMERNIEKVSAVPKSKFHGSCNRRNRIVIFGMPNCEDDLKNVQELAEYLYIKETRIKKIFRINSKTNNDKYAPPLNIEFYSMEDKNKFFNYDTRNIIKNVRSGHLYEKVSIAPDRSFKERQQYRLLRVERDQRNQNLWDSGIGDESWIIRKMTLEKVQVDFNDDE